MTNFDADPQEEKKPIQETSAKAEVTFPTLNLDKRAKTTARLKEYVSGIGSIPYPAEELPSTQIKSNPFQYQLPENFPPKEPINYFPRFPLQEEENPYNYMFEERIPLLDQDNSKKATLGRGTPNATPPLVRPEGLFAEGNIFNIFSDAQPRTKIKERDDARQDPQSPEQEGTIE